MRKTILLADDSVTIQKVVELTFLDGDWEVMAVGNGDEALARLARQRPDLVIADVHMPGASGYEVCRQVKEQDPGIPVLLLVGTFEPFDPLEAEAAGADRHLRKPFDSQELIRLVEELAVPAAAAAPPAAVPEPAPEPHGQASWEDLDAEAAVPAPAWEAPAASWEAPAASWEAPAPAVEPFAEAVAVPEPEPEAAAFRAPEATIPTAEAPLPPPTPAPLASPLSEGDLERLARRVAEILGDRVVREVAWDVIPDLAEVVIKDRLRELEAQAEGATRPS